MKKKKKGQKERKRLMKKKKKKEGQKGRKRLMKKKKTTKENKKEYILCCY